MQLSDASELHIYTFCRIISLLTVQYGTIAPFQHKTGPSPRSLQPGLANASPSIAISHRLDRQITRPSKQLQPWQRRSHRPTSWARPACRSGVEGIFHQCLVHHAAITTCPGGDKTHRPLRKPQIHLASTLSSDSLILLQASAHGTRGNGEVAVVAKSQRREQCQWKGTSDW